MVLRTNGFREVLKRPTMLLFCGALGDPQVQPAKAKLIRGDPMKQRDADHRVTQSQD